MKNFSISMDVEPDLHKNSYTSLEELSKFLILLKKHNIKMTFFVTCDCIEKNPKIFKEILKEGHEISLHGFKHERLDAKSSKEKEENIRKAMKCFKKNLQLIPAGFRAVQHSIDEKTLEVLKNNNFRYDSSIIPWNLYHLIFFWKIKVKFSHNFIKMKPHLRNSLIEIPMSSFVMPFSALTLRVLPKPFLRIYLFFISHYKSPVFLMHSWDLIEMPDSKIYRLCPLEKFLEKMDFMLSYLSKKGKSLRIIDLANSYN
jgi:peptidoglycan/xylan/chitin deacetylase (PgdA/CDA1 family)